MEHTITSDIENKAHEIAQLQGRDPSDVMLEGLSLVEAKIKHETLRQMIQEGLDSGEATPLDMEAIKAEARRRWELSKQN